MPRVEVKQPTRRQLETYLELLPTDDPMFGLLTKMVELRLIKISTRSAA